MRKCSDIYTARRVKKQVGEWTNLVITCLDKKAVLVKVLLSVVKVPC